MCVCVCVCVRACVCASVCACVRACACVNCSSCLVGTVQQYSYHIYILLEPIKPQISLGKIPSGNKTYSGVVIFPLNAASCPARRIVSRMILVALPPFIRDDPLMASAYEERPELLLMGGHSINISNNFDIFYSMPVSWVLSSGY